MYLKEDICSLRINLKNVNYNNLDSWYWSNVYSQRIGKYLKPRQRWGSFLGRTPSSSACCPSLSPGRSFPNTIIFLHYWYIWIRKIYMVKNIAKIANAVQVTNWIELFIKHCQRHNGPEGWVHITSSNTNLDQISSSESRSSINFKITTKHQPLHKT